MIIFLRENHDPSVGASVDLTMTDSDFIWIELPLPATLPGIVFNLLIMSVVYILILNPFALALVTHTPQALMIIHGK